MNMAYPAFTKIFNIHPNHWKEFYIPELWNSPEARAKACAAWLERCARVHQLRHSLYRLLARTVGDATGECVLQS